MRESISTETKKTVSRRAQRRLHEGLSSGTHTPRTSPGNSQPGSRASSRPASRMGHSGDSDDDSDDDFSLDSSLEGSEHHHNDDGDEVTAQERMRDIVTEMLDRKRSNVSSRETNLAGYLHYARHFFCADEIRGSLDDILEALIKSIKGGGSSQERLLALRALSVTIVTTPNPAIEEEVAGMLKTVVQDSEDLTLKAEALVALSLATSFAGKEETMRDELMELLQEIVESDGQAVGADDSAEVVTQAMKVWAFVASQMEEEEVAEGATEAMEAFVEQLESTDPEVQMAAGSNIALLFEMARALDEENEAREENNDELKASFDFRYDPKRLTDRMDDIVKGLSKATSKKTKKRLKVEFRSIVTSIERGKGPGYSTAKGTVKSRGQGEEELGYRNKIRIQNRVTTIDSWNVQARVDMLKYVLGGGFSTHYEENADVSAFLSLSTPVSHGWKAAPEDPFLSPPPAKSKKDTRKGRPVRSRLAVEL